MYRQATGNVFVTAPYDVHDYRIDEQVHCWLKAYGCGLATSHGVDLDRAKRGMPPGIIGILFEYPSRPLRRRLFSLRRTPRRYFLGQLTYPSSKGIGGPWMIHVYGCSRLPSAKRLAEDISQHFCVEVYTHLIETCEKIERLKD